MAQQLARIEYRAIRDSHPTTFSQLSYINDIRLSESQRAVYCVSRDMDFINRFAAKFEAAMNAGLTVRELAKAGPEPVSGYANVILFVVEKDGFHHWENQS